MYRKFAGTVSKSDIFHSKINHWHINIDFSTNPMIVSIFVGQNKYRKMFIAEINCTDYHRFFPFNLQAILPTTQTLTSPIFRYVGKICFVLFLLAAGMFRVKLNFSQIESLELVVWTRNFRFVWVKFAMHVPICIISLSLVFSPT